MNYVFHIIVMLLILLISCASISDSHHGPIYCVLSDDTYVIKQEIEDVINEFNNQLGYIYFTNKSSFDILFFHVMPEDTQWPSGKRGNIMAINHHNTILIKNGIHVNSDYVRQLIVHEIGHFLGLKHSEDKTNVMYPNVEPDKLLSLETAVSQVIRSANLEVRK